MYRFYRIATVTFENGDEHVVLAESGGTYLLQRPDGSVMYDTNAHGIWEILKNIGQALEPEFNTADEVIDRTYPEQGIAPQSDVSAQKRWFYRVPDNTSSVIRSTLYDRHQGTLWIRFQNGLTYGYKNVPYFRFHEFMNAESAGRYYNQNIKRRYESTPEEQVHPFFPGDS